MLLKSNREKSLALLQILAAVFVLLSPSLLGFLSVGAEVYFVSAIVLALITARIKVSEKVKFSFYHLAIVVLLAYGVLSSLWADNSERHLIFLFVLLCSGGFLSLAGEYFAENADGSISQRLKNMLSISGVICAIVNIVYWLRYIVPVAGTQSFSRGLETSDYTAIFLGICIVVSLSLMKGSGKLRKFSLTTGIVLMAFSFIMARSLIAWIFVAAVIFIMYIGEREKFCGKFIIISLISAVVFVFAIILAVFGSEKGDAFGDVFLYGMRNVFGHGGGFWSGREVFSRFEYSKTLGVGLAAYLFATSGILGFLSCILILIRSVMLIIKTKSKESVILLFMTVVLMFVPFGENFTVILLWLGYTAFVEHLSGLSSKLVIKKQNLEKVLYTLYTVLIIAVTLLFLSVVKMSADRAYAKKNFDEAADLYKTVGTINVFDGESCRMAVVSMRKSGRVKNNGDEAIRIIDRAIKRDSDNLENLREKALVYKACEEYELGAQQYRDALQKAFVKDKYNLELAKMLYKVIEKYPKGSSETKRAYEELLSIASSTEDLDLRKEVNDIADKALGYTKGELGSEG